VHIYYGFYSDFKVDSLWSLLSEDERDHASKIQVEQDQCLYVATRASLRKLLTAYLDIGSNDIQFQYGVNGKPSVRSDSNIQFSMAHAGEVFLIGFVRNATIGVDVEHLGRSLDHQKLAGFLFSENEMLKFQSTDTAFHSEQFITCWTRKEAVLKAKGVGFTFPPSQIEVSFLKNEKAEVLSTLWAAQEKSEWFLENLDIPEDYRGAVAVQGKIESLDIKKIIDVNPQVTS
jgi:4'-phosphopantetheinyl transferase